MSTIFNQVLKMASTSKDIQKLIMEFYDPIEDAQRKRQKDINRTFADIKKTALIMLDNNTAEAIECLGIEDFELYVKPFYEFPTVRKMIEYSTLYDDESESDE